MGAKFAVIYSETSVLQYVDNMIVSVFNDIESAKDFICEHMLNPETSYIEFDGLVWVANDAENNKLIQYQIVRLEDFVTDDESTTVPVPCTDEESKAPTVDGLSEQLTPAPIHLFDNIGHAFKSSHKFIEDNLEAVIPAYCYYMGKTTDNTDMLILDVNDDYDYFKLGKLNFDFRRLRALAEEWRYICYYPNRGEDNEDHFGLIGNDKIVLQINLVDKDISCFQRRHGMNIEQDKVGNPDYLYLLKRIACEYPTWRDKVMDKIHTAIIASK